MTRGKDGNVLNKTFIYFHSTNMNTLHHSVLMLEFLNTISLPLWPGQMNTQSNVNGDKRNGENYTRGVQYVMEIQKFLYLHAEHLFS